MKKVLIFASLGEITFGLLLLAFPVLVARLLVAIKVSGSATVLARIAGGCLMALGMGCWPRGESRRQLYFMLAWSVLAAGSLVVVCLGWSAGVLLWPAVAVHLVIAILLWRGR